MGEFPRLAQSTKQGSKLNAPFRPSLNDKSCSSKNFIECKDICPRQTSPEQFKRFCLGGGIKLLSMTKN